MKRKGKEQMVILYIAGILALNYPFLYIFDRLLLALGIPLLYLYIFIIWLAIIVLMALIAERPGARSGDDRSGG